MSTGVQFRVLSQIAIEENEAAPAQTSTTPNQKEAGSFFFSDPAEFPAGLASL
jgi:hypothetical protein